MSSQPIEPGRSVRVVMFGSGPRLNWDAEEFLCRLDAHPDIELLAAFCQADSSSFWAVVRDLWRRRGVLAIPLLVANGVRNGLRFLARPRETMARRGRLRRLSSRIRMVPNIHAQGILDQVRALGPDLGLIYGSPILKPALFELPKLGTLGIHHGKLPEYRGNKTAFWAIYNGEQAAGVTIQKVNAGLDTGSIVLEESVPTTGRSYPAVMQALEELGLDLYMRAILQVKNGQATLRPQTGAKGKLYRNPKARDFLALWGRQARRRFQRPAARGKASADGV